MEGGQNEPNLDLKINKKDIVTIVLLSIVFFSIAVVNLGITQNPQLRRSLLLDRASMLTLAT